jgi:hypothetical protein
MQNKGVCTTCGASDPNENGYCSNGFHAPGETYWPSDPMTDRNPTLEAMVKFLRDEARSYVRKLTPTTGCGLRDDGYVPPQPEDTTFWKAADALEAAQARASIAQKEIERLTAERDALREALFKMRSMLIAVHDGLEDEGDRVYLGSSNHAELIHEAWHEADSAH